MLADPVSVSLRSILLAPPLDGQPVLVYGSGTLAFAAIALLRYLYPAAQVWAATRPGPRAELATKLGAHAVLSSVPDDLVAQIAEPHRSEPAAAVERAGLAAGRARGCVRHDRLDRDGGDLAAAAGDRRHAGRVRG